MTDKDYQMSNEDFDMEQGMQDDLTEIQQDKIDYIESSVEAYIKFIAELEKFQPNGLDVDIDQIIQEIVYQDCEAHEYV